MTIPYPLLKVYKEAWSGSNKYILGDWVKDSDDKIYKAIADGGEAEQPSLDTNNTYWIEESSDYASLLVGFTGLNEAIDKVNILIAHIRNLKLK